MCILFRRENKSLRVIHAGKFSKLGLSHREQNPQNTTTQKKKKKTQTSRLRHIKSTGNGTPPEISAPVFYHKLVLALPEPPHCAEHHYSSITNKHMNVKIHFSGNCKRVYFSEAWAISFTVTFYEYFKCAHSKNLMLGMC